MSNICKRHGASFFQDLHDGVGGGYPGETLEALWSLVWKGLLTNDGMAALRAYCERPASEFAKACATSESAGGVSGRDGRLRRRRRDGGR